MKRMFYLLICVTLTFGVGTTGVFAGGEIEDSNPTSYSSQRDHSFAPLPNELLHMVEDFLDPASAARLMCTNHDLYNRMGGEEELERLALKHYYPLIPVRQDDPRVTPEFAALGQMFEAAGLIWSGVAKKTMDHADAIQYCQDLGQGARLPTKEEYEALKLAMSPEGKYNPYLLPDIQSKYFWSSSFRPYSDYAFFFFGNNGGFITAHRDDNNASVRCVLRALAW